MSLEKVRLQLQAEKRITDQGYPVDSYGECYIPLSDKVLEPIPFDRTRPGNGVLIHFACSTHKEKPLDEILLTVKRQGFVCPRRVTTFATLPQNWILGERISVLTYRSYRKWSSEYDRDYYSSWFEGEIGLTVDQVKQISPEAFSYHTGLRGNRRNLDWAIWSYIPPRHLLGIIDFDRIEDASNFEKFNCQIWGDYSQGRIDEITAVRQMTDNHQGFMVQGINGEISKESKEEFWTSYTAAMTETILLLAIFDRCNRSTDLRLIKPSFEWTKQIYEDALANA